jgi:hypothetical protein
MLIRWDFDANEIATFASRKSLIELTIQFERHRRIISTAIQLDLYRIPMKFAKVSMINRDSREFPVPSQRIDSQHQSRKWITIVWMSKGKTNCKQMGEMWNRGIAQQPF